MYALESSGLAGLKILSEPSVPPAGLKILSDPSVPPA
jgi:hypothetical protein